MPFSLRAYIININIYLFNKLFLKKFKINFLKFYLFIDIMYIYKLTKKVKI